MPSARVHKLRNHREMQAVTPAYHYARDGCIIPVGQDVAHKGLVDLYLVQREALARGLQPHNSLRLRYLNDQKVQT